MGKLTDFSIVFDSAENVYQPGETIRGHVKLDVNKEIKLKCIRVQIHGGATVTWTERHTAGSGKTRRAIDKVFAANEAYFNSNQILIGSQNDGPEVILSPGQYEYPFQFPLPKKLPPSFESSSYGHVRYWAKANVDRPWRFDKITKQPFTVISHLDINEVPDVTMSHEGEAQTTLCCFCCESGPVCLKFKLDKMGFVPGEYIYPKGEVINQSGRQMSQTNFELIQIITFHTKQKSRRSSRVMAQLRQDMGKSRDEIYWTGRRLRVPPAPPTGLPNCGIMDIEYKAKITVDPAGPSFSLQVPLNIVIGTVPLNKVLRTQNGSKDVQVSRIYKECAFGAVDVRDEDDTDFTMGQLMHAPLYPYYTWLDDEAQSPISSTKSQNSTSEKSQKSQSSDKSQKSTKS